MTSKHRRFADNAGFTQHCWECVHARGWHRGQFSHDDVAVCELTGKGVGKFYSPNNQCSHVGVECRYETRGKRLLTGCFPARSAGARRG